MFESFSSKFRGYSPLNFEPFDGPLWVLEDLKISNLYSFAGCGSIGSDHTSSVASKVHFARLVLSANLKQWNAAGFSVSDFQVPYGFHGRFDRG
jgi:hypothetical protein